MDHFCLCFFCLPLFFISSYLPPIISTNVQSYEWMQLYCGRREIIPFPFSFVTPSSFHSKATINWHKTHNGLVPFVFLKFSTILLYIILWVKAIPGDCVSELTEALVYYGVENLFEWIQLVSTMNSIKKLVSK